MRLLTKHVRFTRVRSFGPEFWRADVIVQDLNDDKALQQIYFHEYVPKRASAQNLAQFKRRAVKSLREYLGDKEASSAFYKPPTIPGTERLL